MLGKPRILSFSPTLSINRLKHKHSCKILYVYFVVKSRDFGSVMTATPAFGIYMYVLKFSFGKVYRRIYGRKLSFTATRERSRKT